MLQEINLIQETDSAKHLIAYGIRALRTAAFIETTRDPIMTMLSIGFEKVLKLELGLLHVEEHQTWIPARVLKTEMCVAVMRAEAGRDPHDKGLQDLVGELSLRSDTFRTLWAAHNVRTHGARTKRFQHPIVGELILAYEELAITAEPGNVLLIYTAEPGSPSAERLRLLASWAADNNRLATEPETASPAEVASPTAREA